MQQSPVDRHNRLSYLGAVHPHRLMKQLAILLCCLLLASGCTTPPRSGSASVTFRVLAHEVPDPGEVYVSGDIKPLGQWNPDGLRLVQESDTIWSATITLPIGQAVEFKITRGTWPTEAVGVDGIELPNYKATISGDTTLTITPARWRDKLRQRALISTGRLENKGGLIELLGLWKFSPGDDSSWAERSFDDAAWEEVRSNLPPADSLPRAWTGLGWFRLHLEVDSSLQGRDLALAVRQTGASEWYLNGTHLFSLGRVGTSRDSEAAFSDFTPRVVVLPLGKEQVLAVRYSNHRAEQWRAQSAGAGFIATLARTQDAISGSLNQTRIVSVYQILLTTVGVVLAALHLFLFLFERRELANLYFSLLMLGVSTITYIDFFGFISPDPVLLLNLSRLIGIPLGIVSVFAVLTAHATTGRRVPRYVAVVPALAVVLAAWTVVAPVQASTIGFPALIALVSVEVIRVLLREFLARKKAAQSVGITGWIGGAGAIVYITGVLWQILIGLEVLPSGLPIPPIYAAFMVFAVGISANLALQWSMTNRTLRTKLGEIEELSARALDQERRAREDEVDAATPGGRQPAQDKGAGRSQTAPALDASAIDPVSRRPRDRGLYEDGNRGRWGLLRLPHGG